MMIKIPAFHRRLLRRLTSGGLIIALALGSIMLWQDLERLEEIIVGMGIDEAGQLASTLPDHLDGITVQQIATTDAALERVVNERARLRVGHFISAEIYTLSHQSLADSTSPDATHYESAVDTSTLAFPAVGKNSYASHLVDGTMLVQIIAPINNRQGHQIAWFEGIYLVPHDLLIKMAVDGIRSTMMALLAVVATTGILYPIIVNLHGSLLRGSRNLLAANLGALETLGGAIAKRDSDTNAHNYRVTLYSVRLAEKLGLSSAQIRRLIKGAFLHDVGKIAIPDAVLLKPGKLDADEFQIMKTHVQHGLDIVHQFDWLRDAADVVGCHHEKYDGSGYDRGLAGEDIPLTARIFAIADVFDALTSRRPYKEPFSVERAIEILQSSGGSHFDPHILAEFCPMAPALHAHLASQDDQHVHAELRRVTVHYFSDTLEA